MLNGGPGHSRVEIWQIHRVIYRNLDFHLCGQKTQNRVYAVVLPGTLSFLSSSKPLHPFIHCNFRLHKPYSVVMKVFYLHYRQHEELQSSGNRVRQSIGGKIVEPHQEAKTLQKIPTQALRANMKYQILSEHNFLYDPHSLEPLTLQQRYNSKWILCFKLGLIEE